MTSLIESVPEPMKVSGVALNALNLDARILLPVIIIIVISTLLTAIWALGVWQYLWLKARQARN